jgi:hypothetical protein
MATGNKYISVNASSGSAVAFDSTDPNEKTVHFTCTLACFVVFNQADAGAAATAISNNPVVCGANTVHTFYGIVPSTTWVRSQTGTATTASYWYQKGS